MAGSIFWVEGFRDGTRRLWCVGWSISRVQQRERRVWVAHRSRRYVRVDALVQPFLADDRERHAAYCKDKQRYLLQSERRFLGRRDSVHWASRCWIRRYPIRLPP